MKAKKSLGQNFLTSGSVRTAIRDASDVNADDIILEIGPGKGFLTEVLIIFAGKVVAVEKDRELIPYLKEKFRDAIDANRLEILGEDILDFEPEILSFYKDFDYKVVANIPYYITGPILKKFLTTKYQPQLMVLMVQKEVAQRIVARDKKESILSISVKAYGKPKIVKNVSKKYFKPQPKVDSSVLLIDNISRNFFKKVDEKKFFNLVKTGFAHKRKILIKNLSTSGLSDRKNLDLVFKKIGISENIRAENLTLNDWKNIYVELFT
ncbi:MAG: 16S rRNA (adenine(1518)-N(6)/adenine(1519)-N(6))-dimethyltransferase RsmA [Candidatus Paceibacterota bacterium]